MVSWLSMIWMDDIYLCICFMSKKCRRYDYSILAQKAQSWFRRILAIYSDHFNLKREDYNIFVGMSMNGTEGHISLKQHIDHARLKLQHNCIARSYNQKCTTMVGQLCGLADRILNHGFDESLANVLYHCVLLGYSRKLLRRALHLFTSRHPYLSEDCNRSCQRGSH